MILPSHRRRGTVLIPDGEFNHALKVVRALGCSGRWNVHVCTSDGSSSIRFSRFVRRIHEVDPFQASRRVDEVLAVARSIDADVILPTGENAVRAFSERRHGIPAECTLAAVPDVDSFDTAVDKGRLAALLNDAGLPSPVSVMASEIISGELDPSRLTWPVLCKPVRGSFGRYVTKVDTPSELLEHLNRLDAPEQYIVQEFAVGRDVDVSVLCRDGDILVSTLQVESIPARPGSFEPPTVIRFTRDPRVEGIVEALMHHLKWSGVAHVDLRQNPTTETVRILEVNARYWGSLLGSVTAGVNIPHLACLEALGEPLPPTVYHEGLFCARGITGRLPDRPELPWSWRSSHLPYVIRDPLPELVNRFWYR